MRIILILLFVTSIFPGCLPSQTQESSHVEKRESTQPISKTTQVTITKYEAFCAEIKDKKIVQWANVYSTLDEANQAALDQEKLLGCKTYVESFSQPGPTFVSSCTVNDFGETSHTLKRANRLSDLHKELTKHETGVARK